MLRTRFNLALISLSVDLPALLTEAIFLVHHTSANAHIDRMGRLSFAFFPALLLVNLLLYRTWDRLPEPPKPPGAGPLLPPQMLARGPRFDILLSYVVGSFLFSTCTLAMIAMEWQLEQKSSLLSDQFQISIAGLALALLIVGRARRIQSTGRRIPVTY